MNNDELTINEIIEDDNYFILCTFNKIDIDKNKAIITYYFKIIKDETFIKGESYESIAKLESPYYAVFEKNPTDYDGKINLKAKLNIKDTAYLQVIAKINQENNLEYISYRRKEYSKNITEPEEEEEDVEEEEKEENEEKDNEDDKEKEKYNKSDKGYIKTICVLSGVIVFLLAFIIFYFCLKRKTNNDIEFRKWLMKLVFSSLELYFS
mgnify:CR=1 FL=1